MLANHPNVLGGGGVATNIIGGTGLFADGTVAAPSISFLADQDTGLYRIGANNIGVSANGAKVLDITTTGATFAGAVVAPSLTAPAATNLALAAGSGNQNITLTPSGTGASYFGPTSLTFKVGISKHTSADIGALSFNESFTDSGLIGLFGQGVNGNLYIQTQGAGALYFRNSGGEKCA